MTNPRDDATAVLPFRRRELRAADYVELAEDIWEIDAAVVRAAARQDRPLLLCRMGSGALKAVLGERPTETSDAGGFRPSG